MTAVRGTQPPRVVFEKTLGDFRPRHSVRIDIKGVIGVSTKKLFGIVDLMRALLGLAAAVLGELARSSSLGWSSRTNAGQCVAIDA
jgi:hypothetical protein